MLRSNPVVTQIRYSRGAHDERVMEQQAVPLLRRNRFRRVVAELVDAHAAARERSASALLGSEMVRGRPELLHQLLVILIKDGAAPAPSPKGCRGTKRRQPKRCDG
jgi:hypothetical protein